MSIDIKHHVIELERILLTKSSDKIRSIVDNELDQDNQYQHRIEEGILIKFIAAIG